MNQLSFCIQLELTNCANSRIGNRYDDIIGSGISTGECRRLSFAAEVFEIFFLSVYKKCIDCCN